MNHYQNSANIVIDEQMWKKLKEHIPDFNSFRDFMAEYNAENDDPEDFKEEHLEHSFTDPDFKYHQATNIEPLTRVGEIIVDELTDENQAQSLPNSTFDVCQYLDESVLNGDLDIIYVKDEECYYILNMMQ